MDITEFTEEELKIIRWRADAVWQEIAADVLSLPNAEQLASGIDNTKTITREEVIEWVLDANRMTMYCDKEERPTIEKFERTVDYEQQKQYLREHVFKYELYGW